MTALDDRPQLIIENYQTRPESLTPGDTFTLTLRLTNVGGGDAQRLTLTLGVRDKPVIWGRSRRSDRATSSSYPG